MNDLPQLLLLAGGAGWFLFTYVLGLGKKGALRTLIGTVFYWLLGLDAIATIGNIIWPIARQHITGFCGVLSFVLLPYLLSGLRIYWLREHPPLTAAARLKPRTSTFSLGVLLIITGGVLMSWRALGDDAPRIIDGIPASFVGAIAVLAGAGACCYAISKRKQRSAPVPAR